jgi:methylglutaconyl-CoA hydratase
VTPEDLDDEIARQVDFLLAGGPEALKAAKLLVRRADETLDRDALTKETASVLARLRVSPEGREGLSAFLERRPPLWKTK